MDGQLQSLIDALDIASDERMIRRAVSSYCDGCGYERFAYLHGSATDVYTFNTYPLEFHKLYLNNRYSRIDPVIAQAKRELQVFTWSSEQWPLHGISKEEKQFYSQAIDFGIRSGVTIPVLGSYGSALLLTFATSSTKVDTSTLGDPARVQHAALILHYQLRTLASLARATPKISLSPKEAVCLKWAEKGRTMQETAMIINVQHRTVQHYLDNARGKLGAVNVTQAVAIAKDHGLI